MNTNKPRRFLAAVPGWIVFGMTAIWLAPFGIIHLIQFPLREYWNSHLLYGILFGVSILAMLILNSLESASGYWGRSGSTKKIIIVCGSYSLTMLVGLTALLMLDAVRIVGYYKGDAGGSPGMLVLPSVIFYWVIGLVCIGFSFITRRSRR